MNPDLVAAARAIIAAKKDFPDLGLNDIDKIARSHGSAAPDALAYIAKLRGDHGNAVASALQGVTSNFGDELVGLLPKALGGGKAGSEEMKLRQDIFHADHSVLAPLVEMAGAVGAGLLTGGVGEGSALLQGATRVGTAAGKAAIAGGIYGGLSGAGRGETAAERLNYAGTDALIGMAGGGALGAAAGRIAEHTSTGAALRRQLDAIESSGGMKALRSTLDRFRSAGRGDEVLAADLSPHMQGLADYAANNNPKVYRDAASKLNARQPDITERMLTDVDQHIGTPDAKLRAEELRTGKKDWAATAYDNLRDSGIEFSPEDLKDLSHPTVTTKLREARLAGDLSHKSDLSELFARVRAGSRTPEDMATMKTIANTGHAPERPVNFADMQALKRTLDGKVSEAYRKGNGTLADAWKSVRTSVRDVMIQKEPSYAAIDAEYAAKSRLQDMLTAGEDTWHKIGVRSLQEDMAKLRPEDAEQFRHGLASKLVDMLRDTKTNRNVAKEIMDGGISMQEKLKVIFGDANTYKSFMERVHAEKTMGETRAAVGGSTTHLRKADEMFNPLPALGSIAYGPHGVIASLLHGLVGNVSKGTTSATASKVGKAVFTQGTDHIDALLQALAKPIEIIPHKAATRAGAMSGILSDKIRSLFSGN